MDNIAVLSPEMKNIKKFLVQAKQVEKLDPKVAHMCTCLPLLGFDTSFDVSLNTSIFALNLTYIVSILH